MNMDWKRVARLFWKLTQFRKHYCPIDPTVEMEPYGEKFRCPKCGFILDPNYRSGPEDEATKAGDGDVRGEI